MSTAFVYDAVRTPFGRFGGALAEVAPGRPGRRRPDGAARPGARARPGRDRRGRPRATPTAPARTTATSARMAVLLAGLPVSVPGSTVNRLCGSVLDAAMIALPVDRDRRRRHRARRRRRVDDPGAVGAAQARPRPSRPATSPRSRRRWAGGWSTRAMPAEWTVSLGEATSCCRTKFGISRERQDEFAARSHQLADAAWNAGFYDCLTMPVAGVDLARDEGIRADSSTEKLAALKPAFRPDGTITAGNASPLNDGASAVLLGSAEAADRIGRRPAGPDRRSRGVRARTADVRLRAGRSGRPRARPGRHRLVGRRCRRAERGVRRPVPGLRRRLEDRPGDRQHPAAAPSRSAIPLGASGGRILGTLAERLLRERASAGASPRSASASARAGRRPRERRASAPVSAVAVRRRRRRGGRRHRGRIDRAGRRIRHWPACRSS